MFLATQNNYFVLPCLQVLGKQEPFSVSCCSSEAPLKLETMGMADFYQEARLGTYLASHKLTPSNIDKRKLS